DRFLEITGTISARDMEAQVLDSMDLERERAITIKSHPVRMMYHAPSGEEYELNLIDTPGHVDFTYEVSRSLAAGEGAVLVVDATQGIQAQTLANVHIALDLNLTLIPVVNKIDLPAAEPERVARELEDVIGFSAEEIIFASGKSGAGTKDILEAVVKLVPPPKGDLAQPLRALIFDSKYDPYKGVIAYVRIFDGVVAGRQQLKMMVNNISFEALEVGVMRPGFIPIDKLAAGEVGYIATGLKNVGECQVGDTVTALAQPATTALPGYRPAKPMVYTGLYPVESSEYELLKDALEKLKLNDSALVYEPETSAALGFGFRCGFLGLLHMDVVQERLEREYGLNLLATAPSIAYQVIKTDGAQLTVNSPAALPSPSDIDEIKEPWMTITIITPAPYIGQIMDLVSNSRGQFLKMEYLGFEDKKQEQEQTAAGKVRVMLQYSIPLSEILVDFYDQLKSRSQGYASLDYSFSEYRAGKLVKLDIMVNGQPVDALSLIVHSDQAYERGRDLVGRLRKLIPRQLFEVAVQAAIGSRIIARESIKAMRKNVLAKCYGGDITRKRKLLEKQAEGKKRMKRLGNVEIPQEAFMAVLKIKEQ
ncbi:MAG: translation elongation factor 4, partial [Dehalococcoidia bacterium]|nr:translation elongation factor 4 [Dehalococcoidia bacterium]